MKIGVFDSGVGGKSVADAIVKVRPEDQIIFVNDAEHVPYGLRGPEEIYGFIVPVFQSLIDQGCQVIVVACNTVTTTLIGRLRQEFSIPLVAVEPMVKPACAQTKSGVITVCATPTTLGSPRYAELKATYAKGIEVIEPDCSDWAGLIEQNAMTEKKIMEAIQPSLIAGSDVIVLGCTHYHWIEREIDRLVAGRAVVMQPEQALIRQLNRVIDELSGD